MDDAAKELLLKCSEPADPNCNFIVEHAMVDGRKSGNAHIKQEFKAGRPNIHDTEKNFYKTLTATIVDKDDQAKVVHRAYMTVTGDYDLGKGDSFPLPTHEPIMIIRDPPGKP